MKEEHKKQAEERANELYNWYQDQHVKIPTFIKGYLDAIEQTGVEELKAELESLKADFMHQQILDSDKITYQKTQIAKLREVIKWSIRNLDTSKDDSWENEEGFIGLDDIRNKLEQALNQTQ